MARESGKTPHKLDCAPTIPRFFLLYFSCVVSGHNHMGVAGGVLGVCECTGVVLLTALYTHYIQCLVLLEWRESTRSPSIADVSAVRQADYARCLTGPAEEKDGLNHSAADLLKE